MSDAVPGYCIFGCGFHLVTPVRGRAGGVCGNCVQAGRMDLPPLEDWELAAVPYRHRARNWFGEESVFAAERPNVLIRWWRRLRM